MERRVINYEDWKAQRRSLLAKQIAIEETFIGRASGGRPRDPEKERLLMEMDRRRWDRLIASGKLEKIGPRKWRWRVGQPSDWNGED